MKKVAALLALALAAVALVACGGDDDDTTSNTESAATTTTESGGDKAGGGGAGEAGGSSLTFEADPGGALAYTATEATTEAGKVTIDFDNPQTAPHDVAIEDSGGATIGQTDLITDSSTSTAVDLKPGEYTFYCTVPGHREAGMEGTLTVE